MASSSANKEFTEAVITIPNYPLDEAIDWIKAHMSPDDVFDQRQLEEWAERNGYVEED